MRKILFPVLLAFGSVLGIYAACGNLSTLNSSKNEEVKVLPIAKREATNELPPNWPWRGVTVESRKTRPSDVAYLASIHVNCLRVMMKPPKRANWDKTDPIATFYLEVAWADSIMDACKAVGITTVLCFNHMVLDPKKGLDDKSPEFWSQSIYRDSSYKMISWLAKHNMNRGAEFAAYESIGEPGVRAGAKGTVQPPAIEDFYQKALTAFRKYDTKRYFYLSPGPWGKPTNYDNFKGYNIKDDKLIYGAHMYLPDEYTHQGVKKREAGFTYPGKIKNIDWDKEKIKKCFVSLKAFEKKTNALIYIGEFQAIRYAPGADVWVKDVIDAIEENGFSWTMYAFQCDQPMWDPYYICKNPNADPEKWEFEYQGKNTENWKIFIDAFAKNKK